MLPGDIAGGIRERQADLRFIGPHFEKSRRSRIFHGCRRDFTELAADLLPGIIPNTKSLPVWRQTP
jgi:hypothetical protein